jgi:hypothetical protein
VDWGKSDSSIPKSFVTKFLFFLVGDFIPCLVRIEIRNPKSETNSNDNNSKSKTEGENGSSRQKVRKRY